MLNKTDKGRQELSQKHRTLGQRERAILLMANGRQSESQLAQLFADEGRHLVRALLERGYLERSRTEDTPQTTERSDGALTPSPTPAASHGEQFVGARSLGASGFAEPPLAFPELPATSSLGGMTPREEDVGDLICRPGPEGPQAG